MSRGKAPAGYFLMPEAKREKLGARRQKSHAALLGLVDYFAVWKNTREAG
jgi:hypothetical protein